MLYADYAFYQSCFFGTQIKAPEFPRLAMLASGFLDYCTMNRARTHSDMKELKMACCALAEQYQTIEQSKALSAKNLKAAIDSSESGEVQSQSVGGWSKTYRSAGDSASAAAKAAESAKESLNETARQYLGMTGLLRARGYYA